MKQRRNKVEILFDILSHLTENSPTGKTKLANIAGLNYGDLEKYLDILRRQESVEIVSDGINELVGITEKGRNICTTLTMLIEELEGFI